MHVLVVCQDPRADAIARRVNALASCYRVSVDRWGTNFYRFVQDRWDLADSDVPRRFDLVFLHEADAGHCENAVLEEAGVVARFTTPGLPDEAEANDAAVHHLGAGTTPIVVRGIELAIIEPFPHDATLCPITSADVVALLNLATGKAPRLPRCCLSVRSTNDVHALLAIGVRLEGWLLLDARGEFDEGARPLFGPGGWFESTEAARTRFVDASSAGTNAGTADALRLVWDLIEGGGKCAELDATTLDREQLRSLIHSAHEEFEDRWRGIGAGWGRAEGPGAE